MGCIRGLFELWGELAFDSEDVLNEEIVKGLGKAHVGRKLAFQEIIGQNKKNKNKNYSHAAAPIRGQVPKTVKVWQRRKITLYI